MVKIYTPPVSYTSSGGTIKKAMPVEPVTTLKEEDDTPQPVPKRFVERRKNPDRRKGRTSRGQFESRSGPDRRKSGRKGSFIETKV